MRARILFIGKFPPSDAAKSRFASAAGTIVQEEILSQLSTIDVDAEVRFLAMEPNQIWPSGNLIITSQIRKNGTFAGYINLPIIKNIIYAINIFLSSIKFKPTITIQYNSYLFENIAILICAKLLSGKTCLILQDVRIGSGFSRAARWYDWLANLCLRKFNLTVPITERMVEKYRLNKYILFNGGVTTQGYELLKNNGPLRDIAVFAGALEAYNGIDRLINYWLTQSPITELHIFGRGSLAAMAESASLENSRIQYHGFRSNDEILEWQKIAKFNFCLRYSDGIDEEFFFPSKFFNAACAPGFLIANNFKNLPNYIRPHVENSQLETDLSNFLSLSNEQISRATEARRLALCEEASWKGVMRKIHQELI